MRRQAALTLSLATSTLALLVSACGHDPEPLVTRVAASRIAECGGGLSLSSNVFLAAAINKELRGGTLSIGGRRNLEAAFVKYLNRENYEAVEIFQMYTDCIDGADNIDRMIAAINARAPKLVEFLRSKSVPETEIQQLEALRTTEIGQIEARQFLAARDTRSKITTDIIRIAIGHGIDPTGIDYTLSVHDVKTPAQVHAEQDQAWKVIEKKAMDACVLSASQPECADRISHQILIARASAPTWD